MKNSRVQRACLLVISIVLIVSDFGCRKNPVEPSIRDLRTLTWTTDTIAYSNRQVILTDIWGSSPTNVYVTGSGAYVMLRFDGVSWREVDEVWKLSQGQFPIGFESIRGFSQNDVWIAGKRLYYNLTPPPSFYDSSLIAHFDGTSWQEIVGYPKQRMLTAIGGSSPRDLWFGGVNGTLYHYNGSVVSRDSLPMKIAPDSSPLSFFHSIVADAGDNIYAIVVIPFGYPALLLVYLFKHEASGWTLADETASGFTDLWMSPSGNLYACDGWVYVRKGGAWERTTSTSLGAYKMAGVSENNLIAVGSQGKAFHYNGVDWYQYADLVSTNVDFRGAWTDGNEVFIIGDDGWRSYIYHGR